MSSIVDTVSQKEKGERDEEKKKHNACKRCVCWRTEGIVIFMLILSTALRIGTVVATVYCQSHGQNLTKKEQTMLCKKCKKNETPAGLDIFSEPWVRCNECIAAEREQKRREGEAIMAAMSSAETEAEDAAITEADHPRHSCWRSVSNST